MILSCVSQNQFSPVSEAERFLSANRGLTHTGTGELYKCASMELTEKERGKFFARVNKTDGCWLWTGGNGGKYAWNGYGKFYLRGQYFKAHRVSFLIHKGDFPDGKPLACHKCDNPICVNPDHLFAGSNRDNFDDSASKQRRRFRYKLSDDDVRRIRELYSSGGITQKQLASQFGVSATCISYLVRLKYRAPVFHNKPPENNKHNE